MKTSSAKAKGRRCSSETRDILLKHEPLLEDDILVTPSSVTGPDLVLSPLALSHFPFVIECKNCEKLNIWKALEQAESHAEGHGSKGATPLLVFKRNHTEAYVALKFDRFLELMKGHKPE